MENDGKAYCQEDFFNMFAPKCAGCNLPVMAEFVNALNLKWHTDCFVCAVRPCVARSAFGVRQGVGQGRRFGQRIGQGGHRAGVGQGGRWVGLMSRVMLCGAHRSCLPRF